MQDRKIVKDIIVLYFCNNFTDFKIVKYFVNFADSVDIPVLNISGKDLIEFGFENRKDFSKIISLAREMFVNGGFVGDVEELLMEIENFS